MAQALQLVVGRLEVLVGHQQHGGALLQLDLGDLAALLVEQERHHFHRHLHVHGGRVLLHRLFLDDAQDLQSGRFGVADVARAVATRTRDVAAFAQRRAQALAAEFEQAELADGAELHSGAVEAQRVAQALFHLAAVLRLFHVDEVDDDQAAEVAQAHLARDLVGGFQVGAGGGFLDVAAARGAGGVDVDGDQRLGVVDDDGATGRQVDRARERGLDLVLDLESAEQRRIVTVALHAIGRFRHHVVHELLRLLEDVVRIDQDLADVGGEVIADGADDQRRFLIDEERALARLGGAVDGVPQLEHVVQVPLELGRAAADAGGTRDEAHALRVLELVEVFLELFTVFALDATADATAARVVRHQHQVAAGQRHERGQCRTLVAALFLLDLHQEFLAVADRILDAGGLDVDAFAEIGAGDFLERQETVAVFAVIDETGLERRLDARDDRLVDIALALFAPLDLVFEIEQFLSVDDGQPAFFRLRRVDEHAFHVHSFFTPRGQGPTRGVRFTALAPGRCRQGLGSALTMHEKLQPNRWKESPWTVGRTPETGAVGVNSVGAGVSVLGLAVPDVDCFPKATCGHGVGRSCKSTHQAAPGAGRVQGGGGGATRECVGRRPGPCDLARVAGRGRVGVGNERHALRFAKDLTPAASWNPQGNPSGNLGKP